MLAKEKAKKKEKEVADQEFEFNHSKAVNTFACLYPELMAKGEKLAKIEASSELIEETKAKEGMQKKEKPKEDTEGLQAEEFEITKLDV